MHHVPLFFRLLSLALDLLPKLIRHLMRPPRRHILVKHLVHLLQCLPRSLGVQEEHMEGHHRAEHTEDDVRLPLDVGEGRRDEVRQCEVEDPVASGGQTHAFGAILEGKNFRAVDPCGGGLQFVSIYIYSFFG